MPDAALREQELLSNLLDGFVWVRWLFVACLVASALLGHYTIGEVFPLTETVAVGAVVCAYNVLFSLAHRLRRGQPAPELRAGRIEAGLQIGLDLLALTALVHYFGAAESPLITLYLIHAIAGGMLLSNRGAWLVAAAAFALFLLVVLLDLQTFLPARHAIFEVTRVQQQRYQVTVCAAFVGTLVSSVSIATWIMNGLRTRERQLVHIQKELLKNSQDLEKAYASLTRQQNQLVQTEKQASLGRLVAGIAHEINNPIQFIHGNMAVLSEAFLDALPLLDEHSESRPGLRIARLDYPFFRQQVPVLLDDMANGAARIRAIVRDLKTFARRDEGGLDEEVDLTETVRASVRLLHNQLKHFRIEEDLDPQLPRLRGNLTQLQQVVVNALQNACQAMRPDADGVVRVRTRLEPGGKQVRLTVQDNGCGIPPEVRDRIFDPFFTTRQRTGGTGLGLAITDGIVKQHQGQIEVETEVGKGTAFHFLLPLRREGTP